MGLLDDQTFPAEWERCRPYLESALHRGGDLLTIEDVRERVETGLYEFWPGPDSALVTQVIPGSGGRAELNILLGGGNMETLREMVPCIEAFAREIGVSLITVLGRTGWSRSFLTKEMGYRPVAVLLGKELKGG